MRYARWYELDGFIVMREKRHGFVRGMWTTDDGGLSDHRPKGMKVKVGRERWRAGEEKKGRTPRIRWEVLREMEKREEFERRTEQLEEGVQQGGLEEEWKKITGVVMKAAEEVCGIVRREVGNPWTVGHEEELEERKQEVVEAVRLRNTRMEVLRARRRLRNRRVGLEEEVEELRERVKVARKQLKRRLVSLEREWWGERIGECREACERGRIGEMYSILRKIGRRGRPAVAGTKITAEEFKEHFEGVSRERYEVEPGMIERVVARAKDLREEEKAVEANEFMNEMPEREEIMETIESMKGSAPGEDGVRIEYLKYACEEVKGRVVSMVQDMFDRRAHEWDESVKVGVMIPLHKKGDREMVNNFRGVCLLTMGSRILAKVVAKRLGWWAEHLDLLDENQAGFRKGRSTADVVQIMMRMQEDVTDCKRRVNEGEEGEDVSEDEWPYARLLDLRKAYPRVSKPALWMLLERYGLKGRCMETVYDLHESTEYKVRGRDGESER